ncbi:zinc finger protein 827 isoform X1 [Polypterus senegalus]|uniref:zinc finger protein 827 isoform X1 n=1 Tax=Polypterus senegalus TaxID=55291 RepID=UPI001964F08D|nr:zinc finger protein 827 isoform X1 [Polypterus senegalus]
MPRRKQEQPKRLPSHGDRVEGIEEAEPVEDDGWFGNTSDTPSESSFGDIQDDLRVSPIGHQQDADTSTESSLGCPTPVQGNCLELLGNDSDVYKPGVFTPKDHISSVVSSLYGDGSQVLNKPLSSNLRRLLEAGSITLDVSDLALKGRGIDSPPVNMGSSLALSPSSHHAQQLSALARKLASSASAVASPTSASSDVIKQEPCDFVPNSSTSSSPAGSGFVWGSHEKWPPSSAAPNSNSLSPDSAIQKLKAAANAVLQNKNVAVSSSSSSSTTSLVGGRPDENIRFDAFASPFSPQSASSTLAALSKKVSERGFASGQGEHQPPASSFLSLVSMTSSAALLKEVAARAAGNLLADKKEPPLVGLAEEVKPLLDKNPKITAPSQTLELLLPSPAKGRTKMSNQGVAPEDGGKPFQCPVCGLVIKRKSYWKRHMVIHTGLKSHQCPLCPFRCARKDNLKSHMKVHQHQDRGETFQCELCPFTSSRHFSLKLHMRCHQHFPRTEVKVKEEATTDTEGEGSLLGDPEVRSQGQSTPGPDGMPQQLHSAETPNHIHVSIKEEPQERDIALLSFPLGHDRSSNNKKPQDSASINTKLSSPTASIFNPDISTKTATDLLIKLSAANQKDMPKPHFTVKEEPLPEASQSPLLLHNQSTFVLCPESAAGLPPERALKMKEGSPLPKSNLLNQDINVKVASELLMKLSAENNKEINTKKTTVKEEPMEVDIPSESPAPPHILGFGTLPDEEKSEPVQDLPDAMVCPQKDLFSQDISVKMASELLFKLSEKVNKANDHKDNHILNMSSPSPFLNDSFRQSPFNSSAKDLLPHEPGRTTLQDSEKMSRVSGNGVPQWKLSEQLFPCNICGKVFGRQQTLSRHISLHTEERKYKCHLCPYAAKCRANLNQHLTIHSVKLVSTDADEIVSAVTAESIDRKHYPYYYSCHVCGFETELNAQFVSHMSLHVDKEQWMFSICCSTCEFVCTEEGEMKTHISGGHTGHNSKSPLSETKSTSSVLSALSDSVNGSDCSEVVQGNEELKSLLAPPLPSCTPSSLGSQSGSGTEEKSEKGFECVFCNFVCKTKMMYERHLQIHLITRMFECDVCHKFMKTPEQLLEHKKCHTVPTGGLKCPFCIYSTNRPTAMECHLKTHYKMEYKCRICQAMKSNQLELEMHIREHRLGNHYKCEQCGYLSKTANKLIEHVRVHTGERPFHCDQCSYSCKRKDNLNLHKKLKHAPRQTFSCTECSFTTTHPFVFSRHIKKHQNGECLEDEQQRKNKEAFLVSSSGSSRNSSPLLSLSASQALQSVALSVTGKQQQQQQQEVDVDLQILLANGTSISSHYEKYRNCDLAHLIPLTTLFPATQLGIRSSHSFQPSLPSILRRQSASSCPSPAPSSLKHSFLGYLGLTEKADNA